MVDENDPITKLPKLHTQADYILWRRRVYAFLRRNDVELLGLSEEPEDASAAVKKRWFEASTKAKSTIILCLGDAPLAQTRLLVDDDDRSAKELWDELMRIFTTSNTQSILNIRNELDRLVFEDQVLGNHRSSSNLR